MRIVVLAGGTSTERDVSISSGLLVAAALREKGHEVVLLDVFKGYEQDICDVDALFKQNYSFTDSIKVGDTISDIEEVREQRRDKSNRWLGENIIDICACADIIFLALHGGAGENGQIQATLDLLRSDTSVVVPEHLPNTMRRRLERAILHPVLDWIYEHRRLVAWIMAIGIISLLALLACRYSKPKPDGTPFWINITGRGAAETRP